MRKYLTPLKAIRVFCLQHHGSHKETRLCPESACPLYPFRFGKNPHRKGISPNASKIVKKTAVDSADFKKENV